MRRRLPLVPSLFGLALCGLIAAAVIIALPGARARVEQRVRAVSSGDNHSCAIVSGGKVECWGDNTVGALGSGNHGSSSTPVPVRGLSRVVAVGAGMQMTCALIRSGRVKCWGYDWARDKKYMMMDIPDRRLIRWTPVTVPGVAHAVALSVGAEHVCALIRGGTIKCWGGNSEGQTGSDAAQNKAPVEVPGVTGAVAVSAGYRQTCALLAGGKVSCWGFGPLGDGTGDSYSYPVPVEGLGPAVSISVGNDLTCAVLASRRVSCWGGIAYGPESPYMDNLSSDSPRMISGIKNAVSVSSGYETACALIAGGRVECWGWNSDGQLGNGKRKDSPYPVWVEGIENARSVSVSEGVLFGEHRHVCATLAGGGIRCWGADHYGELGNGRRGLSPVPVRVRGLR